MASPVGVSHRRDSQCDQGSRRRPMALPQEFRVSETPNATVGRAVAQRLRTPPNQPPGFHAVKTSDSREQRR